VGVDWVALSFVQRAEDIAELRTLVGDKAKIMAKLEKPSAVAPGVLDDIIMLRYHPTPTLHWEVSLHVQLFA
jgi:pyruvate kinase